MQKEATITKYFLKVITLAFIGSWLAQWLFFFLADRLMDSGGGLASLGTLLGLIPIFLLLEVLVLVNFIHYLLRKSRLSLLKKYPVIFITYFVVILVSIMDFFIGMRIL